ncbi:type II secretion system protein GspI [Candidatus Endobugula sertula]|uniref:Type II secretion system protein I n=1 Tax=Candidatus Endobugula sertula TaxID=62101 RepID=A0A1D2QSN1_9GAMM|nr:type II secretion system protein GspI [Candidatus Endobugula sertula]
MDKENKMISLVSKQQILKAHAGFSLLEVLAATAIIAFTIPALMLLMMKQADTAGALRNKSVAFWIAENTLTRLRLERQIEGSVIDRPLEETVTMAGLEWIVLTEPEETDQASLLRYRTTVSLEPDEPLVTVDTFIH